MGTVGSFVKEGGGCKVKGAGGKRRFGVPAGQLLQLPGEGPRAGCLQEG